MKSACSLAAVVLLSMHCNGWGATDSEVFSDLVGEINRDLSRTTRELERLDAALRIASPPRDDADGTIPRGMAPWEPTSGAATAVAGVQRQLAGIEEKLRALEALEREIQREKQALEKERDRLKEEKADLEDRERLWSMGFYASLSATTAAVIGLIIRLPTFRLERRLTRLEIEQKEIELARARRESV